MIAENILLHRKRMKWNQDTLAKKIGMSQGTISLWEKGASVPSLEQISKLARIFGISMNDLVGDDPSFVREYSDQSELIRTGSNSTLLPSVTVTLKGEDGVEHVLMKEATHYISRRRTDAQMAEAAEILQSMTDEEYQMALNILRAMKK